MNHFNFRCLFKLIFTLFHKLFCIDMRAAASFFIFDHTSLWTKEVSYYTYFVFWHILASTTLRSLMTNWRFQLESCKWKLSTFIFSWTAFNKIVEVLSFLLCQFNHFWLIIFKIVGIFLMKRVCLYQIEGWQVVRHVIDYHTFTFLLR